MKIVMMTNTYLPHVGGVARSVETLRSDLQEMGHEVLVVAPEFSERPRDERSVIRVPAIQRFNGSDFSVRLPIPGLLRDELDRFDPDIIHSHHPFLLGDTALRAASARDVPLVFTHHTMYEHYTHYVPGDSSTMQRFAKQLAVEYCNLCDHVIAPSESVAGTLRERGVTRPVTSIPTGVDIDRYSAGNGSAMRAQLGVPNDAPVIGHVGRLAEEKNLVFLAEAMARALERCECAHAVIIGDGPAKESIRETFRARSVGERLHFTGVLSGDDLINAYHAMNVFGFASKSETQGMVLAEAMAAATPVVALDAPGARELVRDGVNGRLLREEEVDAFCAALVEICELEGHDQRRSLEEGARRTAESVSRRRCARRVAAVYESVDYEEPRAPQKDATTFDSVRRVLETEWRLWTSRLSAAADAFEG